MAIGDKIKGLIKTEGYDNSKIAKYLDITPHAWTMKMYRGTYTAEDLIRIADCLGYKLMLVKDDITVTLTIDDIREK